MEITLDDIFDDDNFGLLNPKDMGPVGKTDEDRMIDSFEEINTFFEKNNREPSTGSMSEYNLSARLKAFRSEEYKKVILKPFDRFNLLGHVEIEKKSFDEIINEDELGILTPEGDLSIFEFKHTPIKAKEAKSGADLIANRKPMSEEEFVLFEMMFQQVHKDLNDGKRKLVPFYNSEKNLQVGNFYVLDGIMLYLESADLKQTHRQLNSGNRSRIDGRTVTVFENATKSDLLFRSLGKVLLKDGKIVTQIDSYTRRESDKLPNIVSEEDRQSGWVYVLKSKSDNPAITSLANLYKIGFSTIKVEERIKNARHEATYLYNDVEIVASYSCYNVNPHNFENLLHRFFGECCLDIDLYNEKGQRANPREWFVVPLNIINEAIDLILSERIYDYRYDKDFEEIAPK